MLWIASVFSNIGTWMHEVGAGWLMTSLSPSPLMVALVQAATTFPVFLLAMPAGALADILDRRRYLIVTQIWMMAAACLLALFTLTGATDAGLLLLFTFALGVGSGMMVPAWSAIMPELVPREELQAAISLNSVGMNLSRAIGPALAGLIIAAFGSGVVFLVNAVSFLAVILALVSWKRDVVMNSLPTEHLLGAMRAGMRYARHSPELQTVLIRIAAFVLFASASWALMPLIVRQELQGGPQIYGLFLASLGIGAIAGAFVLSYLRQRVTVDFIVAGASVLFAVSMLALAHIGSILAGGIAMFLSGMAWISVISTLMNAAQMALPAWVRARGLAFFWVVFMGSMAIGSAFWGQIASWVGIPSALTLAALCAIAGIGATRRFRVGGRLASGQSLKARWPITHSGGEAEPDRGPIMVTIEYRIDPQQLEEFASLLHEVKRIRRRDGAFMWEMFTVLEDDARVMECFMVESWLEHLRQHERVTKADRLIYDRTRAFQRGSEPPKVTHYVARQMKKKPFVW